MHYEFLILLNKFFDSLEEQKIPVHNLMRYLKCALQFIDDQKESTMSDVQNIMINNSSFFDYSLIKYMIKLAGTEDVKALLLKYEETFHHYSQSRVYKCPSNYGAIQTQSDAKMQVKLDKMYDECTVQELEDLECKLCSILQISVYVVRLLQVERGCFKLTFLIPCSFQATVFPLSAEQERALKVQGILQLNCGKYHFPSLVVSL